MESLESYLNRFYQTHKESLQRFYPGLTRLRLRRELETLMFGKPEYQENFFSNLYIPTQNPHITDFFDQLLRGLPLEYITGRAYFFSSEFRVNSHVLIPRSESEVLVEKAIERAKKRQVKSVCDVGTGSGALLISLLQHIERPVQALGVDISEKAIKVSKQNAFELQWTMNPHHHLTWKQTDRLQDIEDKFSLIISNPPYIKASESTQTVHQQVSLYEPSSALYLPDEEYESWFEEFFQQVSSHLMPKGEFLMEGHENELQGLANLWSKSFPKDTIQVMQDLTGRERVLWVQKQG